MTEEKEACARCRFWEAAKEQGTGECHGSTPCIIVDEKGSKRGYWPVTQGTDWCRHYEEKMQRGTSRPKAKRGD